ncbi:MAG: tRNA threonylcarbamoyladenosine dehydratase [Bacteroidales bacterium]|nr:tRNA threonylcarbamoyladenosine dehydratase [Bacteroidales bacterium]
MAKPVGIFDRAERLLGPEVMEAFAQKKVILFGLGGVGSWCAEGLVRSGVSRLTIVDSDDCSVSNINRQLMATVPNIGRAKTEAMKEHLLEINPDADISAIKAFYSDDINGEFHLEEYDYVIDCIDSLKDKIHLLMNATRAGKAEVYSSMGAALKIDPTRIRVAEFWDVRGCTLGAIMRKRMRRNKLTLAKKVSCVYSEEVRENLASTDETCDYKAVINGSLCHITAIFGFTLAGLVLQHIEKTLRR